jgi:hypothetical protein
VGKIVVPRPAASASLTGRRQKEEGASYHYSLLERSGKRRSILPCN